MSSIAQRTFTIGLETTPGTAVTVDTALRAVAAGRPVVNKIVPDENIGSYAPGRHYIGDQHFEGSFEMDGYYEHAPYPISMALGAGTVVTSGTPEVWTFAWPQAGTVAHTFATYTVQLYDGDKHHVRSPDVFSTTLEISGEAGKAWMFKSNMVGGAVSMPGSAPTVVAPPATVRPILMAETSLCIDSSYGSVGSTTVSAALISFVWKLEGLHHQKLFAGALYPTGRGLNKWSISLELVLEADNTTVDTLKDTLLATTLSAVRLRSFADEAGGSNIDWYVNIDGMYYVDEIGELDSRDGNNTLKITLKGQMDSSLNTGVITIANDLAAL